MLARHLWVAALACCLLATTASPASAQTQKADAVLLARTLADGFTAIDAHRSQARAAVDAWYADQGRCAEPHLRLPARSQFTTVRRQMLHAVALQALAPDLQRLTETLRALPVKAPAIRGGIREVLIDYRNARELIDAGPPNLCRELRRLRAGRTSSWDTGAFEDVRGSERALERRGAGLRGGAAGAPVGGGRPAACPVPRHRVRARDGRPVPVAARDARASGATVRDRHRRRGYWTAACRGRSGRRRHGHPVCRSAGRLPSAPAGDAARSALQARDR